MKVTLVPSAVSVGGGNAGFFLSSYLIDEVVAIDAGGLGLIDDLRLSNESSTFSSHTVTLIISRRCRSCWTRCFNQEGAA